jgi:serine/threonine protein kinase/tetratricopeptide (TPR) repeat protein
VTPTASEVFAKALSLKGEERARFLDGLEDPELAAEVRSLLDHERAAGEFMGTPVPELSGWSDPSALSSRRVGSYELLELLGGGGMGVVYLARQESPRRTVALKVIRPLFVTERLLRRFALEAEVLGRLRHKGIAQIYEAGMADPTNTGEGPQPYFAMEYVSGPTLTSYAAAQELDTRARLALVADVCDAIEHAHQAGVIHRDLKPGNVLVEPADEGGGRGEAQVKVLDFGVAHTVEADGGTATRMTDVGQLVGTPSYMSPEQATGEPAAIDHRSDVYSLGVLAYELCSGRLPHDVAERPVHEAARIVREEPPTKLSSVAPLLAGDVETIIQTALAKEPDRRYPTAAAFAADIRRWLADEPIAARPPSRVYQLRKFARRNRTLVGGVLAVILALGIGLVATLRQTVRLADERERALSIATWFEDMLARVNPGLDGRDVQMVDVLIRSDELSDSMLADPELEYRLRSTLGNTFHNLGEPERAERHLSLAAVRAREVFGAGSVRAIQVNAQLGAARLALDRVDDAEELLNEAHADLVRILGADEPRTLKAAGTLGQVLQRQGRLEEAETLMRETLTSWQSLGGKHAVDALAAEAVLGWLLTERGQLNPAAEVLGAALERGVELEGEESRNTLRTRNNLANTLSMMGDLEGAERHYRALLEIAPRVLGPRHPDTLACFNNLGQTLVNMGRFEEAEAHLREALELRREVLGDDHVATLTSLNNLASLLNKTGRPQEAEPLYLEARAELERRFGPDDWRLLATSHNLARLWMQDGRAELALPVFEEILSREEAADPPTAWRCEAMRASVGICLRELGRFAEAERVLLRAYEGLTEALGAEHPRTRSVAGELGR